jgi:transposase
MERIAYERVYELRGNGYTWEEIALAFEVSAKAVYNWRIIQNFDEDDPLKQIRDDRIEVNDNQLRENNDY